MSKNKDFKFYFPLKIEKAKNEDGEEIMKLGGIASTFDEDADGEFLDPSGFEIEDFIKVGLVNWHHQADESPKTIIGEPTKAEVRKEGFYVETVLYPSSELAKEVYGLAIVMQKDSKTRKLGYSIEGSVIERDEQDPRKVLKAKITGIAITHMPKNANTFADIIKGCKSEKLNKSDEEDPCWDGYEQVGMKDKDGKKVPNCVPKEEKTEKDLSTSSGAALTKESVDGVKKVIEKGGYNIVKLDEESMYDLIFDTFTTITINKAEKVYDLLNKIQVNMKKGQVNDDQLQKAMNALGLDNPEENPFLEKSKKGGDDPKDVVRKITDDNFGDADHEDEYEKEIEEERKKKNSKESEKGSKMKKGEESKKVEESEKEEDLLTKGAVLILKKAIESNNEKSIQTTKAVGMLVKGVLDENKLLKGEIAELKKGYSKFQEEVQEKLEKSNRAISRLSGTSRGRKSITKGGFREKESFQKGNQQDNSRTLSMTGDYNKVLNLVDGLAFAKGGYDEQFAKAATSFEISKSLPSEVISRIKNEQGISISN